MPTAATLINKHNGVHRIGRYAAGLLLLALLPATNHGEGVLRPQGPIAAAERLIFLDAAAIMLVIVVPVIVATLVMAWWFRASNQRARRLPNWSYSGRVELLVWSIPALVVLFLGGLAWVGSHELDPGRPLATAAEPMEIDVVSLDWKWLFIYPAQGVASINHLVIPTGVPIRFRLTSATVWNVFWIPQLGSMLYCMNGMVGTLHLQADRDGVYQGLSAMISGDGFSSMRFNTDAMPMASFETWMREVRAHGPDLDNQSYGRLLVQQAEVQPYTYRSVSPGLFERIVSQQQPPGDGPSQKPPPEGRSPERG